ncbi:hypothetical protein BAY06_03920 [Elizabethkingia anophelis]|uniref:hypothetical protein n=1 Tax=Elizabethkingia anophelis TaxID=1117645 RepID=UPI00099A2917|nr:hypothetical protein [Elizabethkingia anophelis]OPC51484.1 hypothetical protein BAY06_03920 [Elizabethkingia anophelis]
MEEKRVFGFSELKYNTESDCKDIEIAHSMAFQSKPIPYPDSSHLINMFGGTPAKKESFLSKYYSGKRPQGKHRSKLTANKDINIEEWKALREEPHIIIPEPSKIIFIPPELK